METLEKQLRRVAMAASIDGARQQRPRRIEVAGMVGRDAFVYQRLDLALALGHQSAGAIDVGPSAAVAAIEERHTGPDVDRLLVAAGKILIEAGEEQLLDAAFAIAPIRVVRGVARRGGQGDGRCQQRAL